MENVRIAIVIIGSLSILFGYFRFITDENGNVDLNNYRFTGGIGLVIGGMLEGTQDLFARDMSPNAVSTVAIYAGMLLFYIGFNI